MVSVTKAASDTHLRHHKSTSLLSPLDFISSENSNNISKYQSRNHISSRKKRQNHSFQTSIDSVYDSDQKFSNNNLISTHFPIVNIQKDSIVIRKTSSSHLPTVPKQAGTFIHRLVNNFFSITNINKNKKALSNTKRIKQKQRQRSTMLNTRNISDDDHTFLNLSSKRRKRRRQQRSKTITNNKSCVLCQKYRNCFQILPMNQIQSLPEDSCHFNSKSPMILNSNAATIQTTEPSMSLSNNPLEKKRILNELQCQTIASAVELIFDTLILNYQ